MVDQGKAIKHVKHVMTCHFFMTAGPASAHPFGTNQNCLERRFGVPRLRKVEAWQINLGTLSQTSDHEFWVDEQCGTSNRSSHPATQHHPLHPPHNPPQPLSHLVTLPLPERLLSHSATLAEWPAIQPLSHSTSKRVAEWLVQSLYQSGWVAAVKISANGLSIQWVWVLRCTSLRIILLLYIYIYVLSLFLYSIYNHCLLHASIFLLYIIQNALTFDYSKSLEHTSGICDHTL